MHDWIKMSAIAIVSMGVTWFVISPSATPKVEAAPQIVVTPDETFAEPAPLQIPSPGVQQSRGERNLFAYVGHESVDVEIDGEVIRVPL